MRVKTKFLNVRLFVYETGPVQWFGNNHAAPIVRVEWSSAEIA
jgi:hypothetical protein